MKGNENYGATASSGLEAVSKSVENGQAQNPEKQQHLRGWRGRDSRDIGREQGKPTIESWELYV